MIVLEVKDIWPNGIMYSEDHTLVVVVVTDVSDVASTEIVRMTSLEESVRWLQVMARLDTRNTYQNAWITMTHFIW